MVTLRDRTIAFCQVLAAVCFAVVVLVSVLEFSFRYLLPGTFNVAIEINSLLIPTVIVAAAQLSIIRPQSGFALGRGLSLLAPAASIVLSLVVGLLFFSVYRGQEVTLLHGWPNWIGWLPASLTSIALSLCLLRGLAPELLHSRSFIQLSLFTITVMIMSSTKYWPFVSFSLLAALFLKARNLSIPIAIIATLSAFALFGNLTTVLALVGTTIEATTSNLDLQAIPIFVAAGSLFAASRTVRRFVVSFVGAGSPGKSRPILGTFIGTAYGSMISGSSVAIASVSGSAIERLLPGTSSGESTRSRMAATAAAGGSLGILMPPSGLLVLVSYLLQAPLLDVYLLAVFAAVISAAVYLPIILRWERLEQKASINFVGTNSTAASKLAIIACGAIASAPVIFSVLGILSPFEMACLLFFLAGLLCTFEERTELDTRPIEEFKFALSSAGTIQILLIFSQVLATSISLTPEFIAVGDYITGANLSSAVTMVLIAACLLFLGMIIDPLTLAFLASPILTSIAISHELSPIVMVVFLIVIMEAALITPPLGLNLFIVRGVVSNLKTGALVRDVARFCLADLLRVFLVGLLLLYGSSYWN